MNVLPNYQVLDFVEWLLNNQANKNNLARFCENRQALVLLAEKYLESDSNVCCFKRRAKALFDKVLDRFCERHLCCDLNCSKKCMPRHCQERCYKHYRHFREEMHMLFHEYERMACENEMPYEGFEPTDARTLADSLIYLIENGNFKGQINELSSNGTPESPIMNLMISVPSDNFNIFDFVEWIERQPTTYDFSNVDNFKRTIDAFCKSKQLDPDKTFKDFWKIARQPGFIDKIKSIVPKKNYEKLRSLGVMLERYQRIPFKCIILHEGHNTYFNYEKLIKDYWDNLNALSADYLDIFHTPKDFDKSGYLIGDCELNLRLLRNLFPCILIWEKSKAEYKTISINYLSEGEIVEVIKTVVSEIQKARSFGQVVEASGKFVEGLIEKKRPTQQVNTTINVNGCNIGTLIAGNNHGAITSTIKISTKYDADFDKLAGLIKEITTISKDTTEQALKIVQDTKDAVRLGNKQEVNEQKAKSKSFWGGVGKAILEGVGLIANFATIAGFFI